MIPRAVEEILSHLNKASSGQSELTSFGGSQTNPILNLMTA